MKDLPVHIRLEILDEIPTRKQLDGHFYLGLTVYGLYHQAKCSVPKHPSLQQMSIIIVCSFPVLMQKLGDAGMTGWVWSQCFTTSQRQSVPGTTVLNSQELTWTYFPRFPTYRGESAPLA